MYPSQSGVAITQAQAIDVLAACQITTPTPTSSTTDNPPMTDDSTTATPTTTVVSLLAESEQPEDVTKFLALVEAERIKAAEAAAAAKAAAAAAAAYNSSSMAYRGGGGGGGAGKHSLYDTYGAGQGEMDEYGTYDQGGDDGGEMEFRPPKRHKSSGGGRKSNLGGGGSGGLSAGVVGGDDIGYTDAQGLGDGQGGLGLALVPRPAWLTTAENIYKALSRHAFVSPEKYRGEQVAADFFHPVLDMYPQVDIMIASDGYYQTTSLSFLTYSNTPLSCLKTTSQLPLFLRFHTLTYPTLLPPTFLYSVRPVPTMLSFVFHSTLSFSFFLFLFLFFGSSLPRSICPS